MDSKNFRATAIVMLSLGIAMATGFLRQTALAATLGAGRVTDIFLVAFALPEFVFVALPVILSPVVIPLFMQVRSKSGEATAWRVIRRLAIWLLSATLFFGLLAALAAPLLITWLSPGFDALERQQALAVFYWMLPGLLFMGVSTLVGSLLQVYRQFARPALTTAIYNLIFIASLLVLPLDDPLQRAGLGVTLGAIVALLFQLPVLLQVRSQVNRTLDAATGAAADQPVDLRPALILFGWMSAGYGIHHLILLIDRAMATAQGAGSAAVLNYGYHLALTVAQLSGLAVSTVLFPTLSEQIEAGDSAAAKRTLSQASGLVLALALPAGLGVIVLRQPLVQVLLEHGAFTAQDTRAVGLSLAIYTLAMIADALCQPLWRLVYTWRDGRVVMAINGIQTLIRLAANLILVGVIGYNGLAVSAVIGLSIQLLILMALARRRLDWRISQAGWGQMIRIVLAASLAALATFGVLQGLAKLQADPSPWFILLVGGLTLLLLYGAFLAGFLRRPLQYLEGLLHW